MKDGFTNVTTDYSYDLTGRLVQSAQSGSRSARSSYTYDNMDRVTMQHNFVNDYTQWMTYTYGDDGLLSHSSQHNMGTDFSYTYLNCVESETVKWNNQAVLTNHYGYVMDTQMVQSIQPVVGGVNQGYYSYSYDKAGNIRSVSKNGELLLQYWYDGLGQLTRVDDARQQKTFLYSYSDVGNLEYKAQASYTTTANLLGPPSNYVYYGYSDSEWPDLLTMYNGQSISYDMIGNPLSYRDGMTMSWQNGRQLASLQKGSSVVNYSYDVNGQRVKKTAGGDTVDFYYDDNGRLIKQEDDGGNIWFYYNPTGAAASMSYHGTHYYFLKNLQGDVVALVNMQGDIAARYTYDAWGDIVSVTDENGNAITDQNHVANRNPIRYRGYYYDTESGLYYLNSRYYDPVTGRFVNADGYVSTGQDITGFNMFAYCGNNPVNRADSSGESWWSVALACVAIVAVCAVAIATAPVLATAAAGVGITVSASAIASTAFTVGTIAAGVGVFAGGMSIAQSIPRSISTSKSTSKSKTKTTTLPANDTVIYRYGGTNPGNLTPRKKDVSGLSFSTLPPPPGVSAAVTTVGALNSTGVVRAVKDGPTHISVVPVNATMQDWITEGSQSVWTGAVKSVVVKWDGGIS